MKKSCWCGSESPYKQCCHVYITGEKSAPTAELLMRSRYTAYVIHNSEYLLKTWSTHTRPPAIDFSKDKAEWQQLEIITTQKGKANDSRGIVELKFPSFPQQ